MKIDFSTILNALDGNPLKADDGKNLTLATASVTGLTALTQASQSESGDQKFKAWQLASKVKDGGEVEVDPEDVSFIKLKIAAVYGPAVVGPAFTVLNG